jgi:hypothetical protein
MRHRIPLNTSIDASRRDLSIGGVHGIATTSMHGGDRVNLMSDDDCAHGEDGFAAAYEHLWKVAMAKGRLKASTGWEAVDDSIHYDGCDGCWKPTTDRTCAPPSIVLRNRPRS